MKTLFFISIFMLLLLTSCKDSPTDPSNNNNNPGNEVSMINTAFSPASITVTAGTTVKWTNRESIIHTVTSGPEGSPSGMFDSGNLGKDQTFSFKFDSAGTFPYHCLPHPGMTGVVIVQ